MTKTKQTLSDPIFVLCPHCNQMCEIVKLNCCIFRCGIYRSTGRQLSPHAPQHECIKLVEEGALYGCGKPFQIIQENEQYKVIICDYK